MFADTPLSQYVESPLAQMGASYAQVMIIFFLKSIFIPKTIQFCFFIFEKRNYFFLAIYRK